MRIWMKKEKKDESVSLSFWAMSGFIYLLMATLHSIDTKTVDAVRDAFLITSATYLGRRSPFFNMENKEEPIEVPKDSSTQS